MSDFIGHVPVPELLGKDGRYGFGKTKVYECLEALSIERVRRGQTSYVTEEDLQRLDRYVDILNTQGKAAAKAFADGSMPSEKEKSAAIAVQDSGVPESSIVSFVQMLSQLPVVEPAADVLAPQRQLDEVVEKGWVLSTQQVRRILGIRSWSGSDRFGFKFEKTEKIGSQNGWRVSK